MITRGLLFLILILLSLSCNTQIHTLLYHKDLHVYSSSLSVNYQVRHEGNESFLLLQSPATSVSIAIKAYTKFDGKEMLYDYEQDFTGAKNKIYKLKIDSKKPLFVLYVKVTNLETQAIFSDLVPVNRLQDNNQSIYLVDSQDDSPLLKNYFGPKQEFRIEHRLDSIKRFFVKYFRTPQKTAPVPDGRPSRIFNPLKNYDAIYEVVRGKGLKFSEAGLYFVQTDSNSNKGIFLNCFVNNYPKTTSVEDLVISLRYISKKSEYDKILKSENQKRELDKYWLGRRQTNVKSTKKAKSLISIYYNRIQNANLQFTSFKEGWKTDRGMIYVVFGKPNVVRKYAAQEVWFYQSNQDRFQVELVFDRIGEQYLLKRSEELRRPWRAEIDRWRKGTVH